MSTAATLPQATSLTPQYAPYKGLVPYAEEDAAFFFGREAERELVIANLTASRFTLLFGGSGVGKSSLLRAGVAHALHQRTRDNLRQVGTPQLAVVVFSAWRDDPLDGLRRAIKTAVRQAWQSPDAASGTQATENESLAETLRVAADSTDGEVIVILDQFEEYFPYHPEEEGEGSFAVEFPHAVASEAVRASFLVSVREDALAKLDRFEGHIPNLFANFLRIDHLDREAARQAIEGPIHQYNRIRARQGEAPAARVEPELVEAVLDQVRIGQVVLGEAEHVAMRQTSPGQGEQIETPYLQLVMNRLWETELASNSIVDGELALRLATLERLGGAQRIVHTHLDTTMHALSPRDRNIAVRIFGYLVTPSGTKIAHSAADLAAYAGVGASELDPVLSALSAARILTPVAPPIDHPAATRYEIFHDVLAGAIVHWRSRYLREQERAEAGQQLAVERQRVWHLRRGLISVSGLLVVLVVLAAVGLLQSDAAGTAQQVALSHEAGHQLESLFLGCFIFGALFTLASAVLGFHGVGGHGLHAAHLGAHHVASVSPSGPAVGAGPAPHGPAVPRGGGSGLRRLGAPLLNASSLLAFLTWFGAAGFVLERVGQWAFGTVLVAAFAAGGVGWYVITRFMDLVLAGEREMNPEDYRLEGTIARVIVSIPAGGTGEVAFTKVGVRRSEAARATTSAPIPRGTEVVITHYANGFATVEPWTELPGDQP